MDLDEAAAIREASRSLAARRAAMRREAVDRMRRRRARARVTPAEEGEAGRGESLLEEEEEGREPRARRARTALTLTEAAAAAASRRAVSREDAEDAARAVGALDGAAAAAAAGAAPGTAGGDAEHAQTSLSQALASGSRDALVAHLRALCAERALEAPWRRLQYMAQELGVPRPRGARWTKASICAAIAAHLGMDAETVRVVAELPRPGDLDAWPSWAIDPVAQEAMMYPSAYETERTTRVRLPALQLRARRADEGGAGAGAGAGEQEAGAGEGEGAGAGAGAAAAAPSSTEAAPAAEATADVPTTEVTRYDHAVVLLNHYAGLREDPLTRAMMVTTEPTALHVPLYRRALSDYTRERYGVELPPLPAGRRGAIKFAWGGGVSIVGNRTSIIITRTSASAEEEAIGSYVVQNRGGEGGAVSLDIDFDMLYRCLVRLVGRGMPSGARFFPRPSMIQLLSARTWTMTMEPNDLLSEPVERVAQTFLETPPANYGDAAVYAVRTIIQSVAVRTNTDPLRAALAAFSLQPTPLQAVALWLQPPLDRPESEPLMSIAQYVYDSAE